MHTESDGRYMSAPKHTAGPWIVSSRSVDTPINDVTYKLFHNPKTLAEVTANITLIAAAPEMFDALNALVMFGMLDFDPVCKADIQKLIAKARGE